MAKLLTYQQIEEMGTERIFQLARDLKPMIGGQRRGHVSEEAPSTIACLCAKAVGEAADSLGGGESPSMVMAELFTSGMLLGYAMAYDQIEQDVALVNAVTGDEG